MGIPVQGSQTLPPPHSEQRAFIEIPEPSLPDCLLAASIFHHVALRHNIEYAIVGGVSAHIFGGQRPTKSLDIILAPCQCGDQWLIGPVIDDLFAGNPDHLNYVSPDRFDHIVVTDGNAGVPINFFTCFRSPLDFPDLVPLLQPYGTPWNQDGPEPTFSFQHIYPPGVKGGVRVPVVLPRLLLWQRLQHFRRYEKTSGVGLTRRKNDVKDIIAYLNVLYGVENQSFTDDEAQDVLPKVEDVLRFAKLYWFNDGLESEKWDWINVGLENGWENQ
jgi:hypothetical protein